MTERKGRRVRRIDPREKLEEIRAYVTGARSMPMSASVMVNKSEMMHHLEDLEKALEDAVADSTSLVANRDEVMDQSMQAAEQMLHDARLERERIVSDTEVFKLAKREAERVLAEAKAEAEALRKEADDYVDGRLANFEITLDRTLDAVRRGRDRLLGRSQLDSLGSEEIDQIVLPEHHDD